MRNHEVKERKPLLNPDGTLREPGWSRRLVQIYNRNDIKKRKTRIKEWDYYCVISNKHNIGVCFTVSDLGYLELESVSFLDFNRTFEHTQGNMAPFPMGKLSMPSTTEKGNVRVKNGKFAIEFIVENNKRIIRCDFPSFDNGKGIKVNIALENQPEDTMVIATPWAEDKKAFYYNQTGAGSQGAVSEYYYDATNVRLRELALGYSFDKIRHFVKEINISLVGRNLFFFYKKAPFDPELSINASNSLQGIEAYNLPSTRSLGFSIRAIF